MDIAIGGLLINRSYNSDIATIPSIFGKTWRGAYTQFIGVGYSSYVWMYRGDGKSYKFTQSGNVYTPDADITDRLVSDGNGGYVYFTAAGETERYNSAGRLVTLTDAAGRVQSLTYDSSHRLSTVTDSFGRTLTFGYDAANRVSSITTPTGNLGYTYDGANNLISVSYPGGSSKTYHYEDSRFPNALTGVTDEKGIRYITYTYDAQGRAIDEVMVGNVERNQLSFGSNQTTVTDPLGTQRTYNFTNILGVLKSTGSNQPGGSGCGPASASLTYDGNGNVATRTDFNGNQTRYTYDLSRNLETKREDAFGRPEQKTISTQWHSYWRLPTIIAEPLKKTTYLYNGDGGQYCAPQTATVPSIAGGTQAIGVVCSQTEVATTDTNGSAGFGASAVGTPRTWTYTYNQYGQVLTADGPRSDVTDTTVYTYYDAADPDLGKRGNVATIRNALGHLTQVTAYDGNGRPLTLIDPNGLVTQLTYDPRGRLTSKTVGNELTRYDHDPVGQLTKVTLPDNSFITYTYDGAHRLVGIADALGNTITYTLDNAGNRLKDEVKDPQNQLARQRQRIFDALSRLQDELGGQGQRLATYRYDPNGNLTGIVDALNRNTTHSYDALNRLTQTLDTGSGQTRYAYDGQDRLTQVTDPRNLITRYTQDGLGNQTQQVSPDTGTTNRSFDAAGNLIGSTDAKGQTSTRSYDAVNRLTQVTYQDGRKDRSTWDQGPNGIGRLTAIEQLDAGGTVQLRIDYSYDPQGRRIAETRNFGGQVETTQYGYTNGKLTRLIYPSGKQIDYSHNPQGQISQISATVNGQTQTLASQITYHPFGGIKSLTNGAGQSLTWPQDNDGRTTGYTLGSQPWQIGYDGQSRIQYQTNMNDASQTASYGYDALDRLTQATLPQTSHGYTYDPTGNRSTQTIGAATRNYVTAADSNRLQSITGSNPKTYGYDANGSVTSDGSATYSYDSKGRLTSATTAAGTASYTLDPLGQRIAKTSNGQTTRYTYGPNGQLLSETTNGKTRDYLWIEDRLLAIID